MVVGEDGAADVALHPVLEQVLRGAGDRVGGLVHAGDAVAVAVGGDPGDLLAGRSAPALPPQVLPAAPPMPICIGPAAPNAFAPLCTPGSVVRPSLLSTLPMPGQHHPRDAVLPPRLLVQVEVVGGDRRPPGGTRRWLKRGGDRFADPACPPPEQPCRTRTACCRRRSAPPRPPPGPARAARPGRPRAARPAGRARKPSRQFTSCLPRPAGCH